MKESLTSHLKLAFCFVSFVCLFTMYGETATQGATFTVTRNDDRNTVCTSGVDCSLREAVNAANAAAGADVINFATGLTTITLANEIVITNNGALTITGLGANVLTVDGGPGTNRIFYTDAATVTITDLRLTGGNGSGAAPAGTPGGAIYVNAGTLTLDRTYFFGNLASIGGALYIREGSDHRIKNSTFTFSFASSCGAFMNDQSSLLVVNSTISGNGGGSVGGGFCAFLASTRLRNVTISNNSAGSAGGIENISGSLQFANTIVAGNSASSFPEIHNQNFSVASEGNNFVGDSIGDAADTGDAISYQATDITDIDPKLTDLTDNGGPTPTQALQPGSFAIDNGSNTRTFDSEERLLTDQRGFLRIVDGDGNGSVIVDMGAYEHLSTIPAPKTFTVTRTDDRNNPDCIDGDCSLREAVRAAALRPTDDTIDFAPGLTNITLTADIFSSGLGTLTIAGPGAHVLTINAGAGTNRIFTHFDSTLAINDLTLTGGNGTSVLNSGPGGAIYASGGSLSLRRVHVHGNSTTSSGGGVYILNGTNHRIRNSTLSGNTAGSGGGLYAAGPLTVVNSTVSGNTASIFGGGIYNESNITLRQATIHNNSTANQGGGIYNVMLVNFANTIIAGNNATTAFPEIYFFAGGITSAGNNLVGDSAGDSANTFLPITYQPTDIRDVNPVLGALQNNGGTTPTHALLLNSPAIDAGNNSQAVDPFNGAQLIVDQRDFQRVRDGNGDSTATVDIGSYEFAAEPTASSSTISGRILTTEGTALAGVVVELNGASARRTITDSAGFYRFGEVDTAGFYTLTPWRTNFSFSPGTRSFSQLGSSTEASFTASPAGADTNPLDTPEFFVRQHYVDFLGREPDEAGFNFWSDQILSCGDDAGCVELKRINVSAAYFLSIEFQRTGGLVDGLYRASYGRRPLYNEFTADTASLAQDVIVGRSGWERQVESNAQAFINSWVQRSAFRSIYENLSDPNYIDLLLRNTGVVYTTSERDSLLSDLTSGRLTRAQVLLRIAQDERFVAAKRNEVFVMMEYFGYLRRDPDERGYQFWLAKLNQFDGNFERAEMVKAFIDSTEYRARFPR